MLTLARLRVAETELSDLEAQSDVETASRLIEDLVHYTLIAKPDLALAIAQELLALELDQTAIAAALSSDARDREKLRRAMDRASRVPEFAEAFGELFPAELLEQPVEPAVAVADKPEPVDHRARFIELVEKAKAIAGAAQ